MTSTATIQDTRTVIERYVSALQRGDRTALRDSFAETATWRLLGVLRSRSR
jgi:hypothetical protein